MPRNPREIAEEFAAAWNAVDPEALAALFVEDADFVNVVGLWWTNRHQIRENHAIGSHQFHSHPPTERRVARRKRPKHRYRPRHAHAPFLRRRTCPGDLLVAGTFQTDNVGVSDADDSTDRHRLCNDHTIDHTH
ncbi:SgcJ/EcaC family oxidoreductase [Pseudarthrobacter sp. RMG13]|uniref:SgcJ/EcaC family oxidoreductase n=1 Tax=Pseudarthrobacter humi TaxID=2952523 RepID=A0ABT1LNG2_9MICC|nr:SgcJ/EcaC family oxidoreductase [Pseudarthrobacter humi]MCP8999341.1 SgcJ/EcaC family oxidoreductase [Pseudarthrobacter humi]